jgi:hypothetical protein
VCETYIRQIFKTKTPNLNKISLIIFEKKNQSSKHLEGERGSGRPRKGKRGRPKTPLGRNKCQMRRKSKENPTM